MVNWTPNDLAILQQSRRMAESQSGRKHKYGAKPEVVDGHRFASKAEANAYRALRLAESVGKISDLELQPRFKMPCGVTYVADFRFTEDRKVRVVDIKGVQTPVFKLKLKLMRYFFPSVEVELWK